MPLLNPGKKAPTFTLTDQSGTPWSLASCAGRPVVLFFYPKDATADCTAEVCGFRDSLPEFEGLRAAVVGVSTRGVRAKQRFAAAHGVTYPLLADDRENDEGKPDPVVCPTYGVWVEKSMYGKAYMGIVRTTYLIGPDGKVVQRWDKVRVEGHAAEVLEAARAIGG